MFSWNSNEYIYLLFIDTLNIIRIIIHKLGGGDGGNKLKSKKIVVFISI